MKTYHGWFHSDSIHHFLPSVLDVDKSINRRIIATGDIGPNESKASPHRNHMFRTDELRELILDCGLHPVVLSASDSISAVWDEQLEVIYQNQDKWQHLIKMEIEACKQPGCVDMGTHIIAVCEK